MKLSIPIIAACLLLCRPALASGSDDSSPTSSAASATASSAAAPGAGNSAPGAVSRSGRLPFLEELDKIDDVNPYVIKSVIIEGNKLIPRSQIKAVIKTKPGDFYHRKDFEEDLRNIYKMGYFDAQQMHITGETTAAGLVLNIKLKENPFLKSITFSGNQLIPTERLHEFFKGQVQKPRSKSQIASSLKTIEKIYHTQGYLLARATTGKDDPEGTMPVTIDEGNLKEIRISGLPDAQKQIIQETLTLKVGSPYNEKTLTNDLKTAIKSGKVDELQRQVDKAKAGEGYILTISALPKVKESAQRTASATLLSGAKNKPALPVLNKLIKSPMYKEIKDGGAN